MKFVIELQPGCWIAAMEGDPGRTLKRQNAKVFKNLSQAVNALANARQYRHFKLAKIVKI